MNQSGLPKEDPSSHQDPNDQTRETQWRRRVEDELGGASIEKVLVDEQSHGFRVKPLYTSSDLKGIANSGYPGQWPYVRGGTAAQNNAERIIQLYECGSIDDVHDAILSDLEGGTHGVYLRLSPSCVPAKSQSDLLKLLDGVLIDAIPIIIDAGADGWSWAALALSTFRKRCVSPSKLSCLFDPLGALARTGTLSMSRDDACRETLALGRVGASTKGLRTLGISTLVYRDGGATSIEELAYGLATAAEYGRWWVQGGEPYRTLAPQCLVTMDVGQDVFLEIAKLRAARILFAKMSLAFDPKTKVLPHFHGITSWRTLSRRDADTNMLRVTTQVFAGILGGVDSLSSRAFDEVKESVTHGASERGRRVARNTQIILDEESHLHDAIDPAGGSYYVESLTDELARKAWEVFQEIERKGGMLASIESGDIARDVKRSGDAERWAIAHREKSITGINEYPPLERKRAMVTPIMDCAEEELVSSSSLKIDLESQSAMEESMKACDLGESVWNISASLNRQGTMTATAIRPFRNSEAFESLRDRVESSASRCTVFVALLDRLSSIAPRVDFARSLFQVVGFDVISGPESANDPTMKEIADAFVASGSKCACVCGLDETYKSHVAECVGILREKGAKWVYVAGRMGESKLEDAALDGSIFKGMNVLEFHENLLEKEGL